MCFVLLFVLILRNNSSNKETSEKLESEIKKVKLIQVCQSQPCKHGGMCRLNESSYNCICINNFTGPNCQFEPGNLSFTRFYLL